MSMREMKSGDIHVVEHESRILPPSGHEPLNIVPVC